MDAFGIGADCREDRAMAVDMIGSGLSIIFDDKDAGLFPLGAGGNGLDNPSQGEVVIGHHRAWGRIRGICPLAVVARQAHDGQTGQGVALARLLILANKDIGTLLVGLVKRPVEVLGVDVSLQASDVSFCLECELLPADFAIFPDIEPSLGNSCRANTKR